MSIRSGDIGEDAIVLEGHGRDALGMSLEHDKVECEILDAMIHGEEGLEIAVELVVKVLEVTEGQGLTKHHLQTTGWEGGMREKKVRGIRETQQGQADLVERCDELDVNQLVVESSKANNSTDELKLVKHMLGSFDPRDNLIVVWCVPCDVNDGMNRKQRR